MRVRQRYVQEHALKHDDDTHGIDGDANDGDDPVDTAVGCPAEEKESDGDEKTTDESRLQTVFGRAKTMLSDLRIHHGVDVEAVDGDCDEDGHCYGKKGQT